MTEPTLSWLTDDGQLKAGYRVYFFSFKEHESPAEDEEAVASATDQLQWETIEAAEAPTEDMNDEDWLPYADVAELQQVICEEFGYDEEDEDDRLGQAIRDVFKRLSLRLRQDHVQIVAASYMMYEGNHNDTEIWVCAGPVTDAP